ncbi:Mis6-domain-containing protein [Phyllosticta citriasiana]|uniref:Mis6-domain-containing protein n=1 Tax=Phyllosticta citriasiana TaxID=595635 RepID=UPI0030FDEDBF
MPPDTNTDAIRAIEALTLASTTAAKHRKDKVNTVVDPICNYAYQNGLDRHQLTAIIHLVTRKTELDQTTCTTLVKNLYPRQSVSPQVVIRVVTGLGQGQTKPSIATQSALLKWLIAVLDVLEDPSVLSKLYGVLFNQLDVMGTRTPLCHLLSLITRRKHVRPFRIQQLLEMVHLTGQDSALVGLLHVYKDYYPDIIIGNAAKSRASLPVPSRDEWRQRLQAIQEADADRAEQLLVQPGAFKVVRRGAKRTKASIVPDVHTSHAGASSVTLEEIDNADGLVKNLHKIELPNQVLAALKDPLFQKYLILNPSDAALRRIELWLESYLREVVDAAANGTPTPPHLSELLQGLLTFTQATKTLLPTVQVFLETYLPVWSGDKDSDAILGLVSYCPIQNFRAFRKSILEPAEQAVISKSGADDDYTRIITLYTQLSINWNLAANNGSNGPATADGDAAAQNFALLTSHIHASILCLLVAYPPPPSTAITSALHHYTTLASLSSATTPLAIPPSHTLYTLLFQPSLATLSSTCALLATYKRAFESGQHAATLPRETTNAFNGYLMDVANLLWRNRALTSHDPNALACLCAPPLAARLNAYLAALPPIPSTALPPGGAAAASEEPAPATGTGPEYSLAALFGLPFNALTAAMSLAAFRRVEDAAAAAAAAAAASTTTTTTSSGVRHPPGPVTQRSLHRVAKAGGLVPELSWKAYRVEVLRWLVARGARGMRDFMFVTMKDLMKEGLPAAAAGSGVGA